MRLVQLIGVVLIAAGILAVVYNRFSYTKDETAASVGPVNITVQERQTVLIPDWAGIVAIVLGGVMVFAGRGAGGEAGRRRPRALIDRRALEAGHGLQLMSDAIHRTREWNSLDEARVLSDTSLTSLKPGSTIAKVQHLPR